MDNRSLSTLQHIYFLGIGGIGMSALARYFLSQNITVSGYDLTKSELTVSLENEGAKISYNTDLNLVPGNIDLVVMTPAVPIENPIYKYFVKKEIGIFKRAEILGLISRSKKCLAIAGTHGKTSTSAILTHILHQSNLHPTGFVGGIMKNYNSNLVLGDSDIIVVEADEYDRSFLHLSPDVLLILSLDADHLDIYGDHQTMIDAYQELSLQVKMGGVVIIDKELSKTFPSEWRSTLLKKEIEVIYTGDDTGNRVENIKVHNGQFLFDLIINDKVAANTVSVMPGAHNINNALGAAVIASKLGLKIHDLQNALSVFKGIKRRFETIYQSPSFTLIDDYAHHPDELETAVSTSKMLFPNKKITVIFQPHLYSRTQDFYIRFAEVLDKFDEIYLLPIYPAREEPIEGVKSEMILDIMKNNNGYIVDIQILIAKLHDNTPEVLLTLGASDINKYHGVIIETVS